MREKQFSKVCLELFHRASDFSCECSAKEAVEGEEIPLLITIVFGGFGALGSSGGSGLRFFF